VGFTGGGGRVRKLSYPRCSISFRILRRSRRRSFFWSSVIFTRGIGCADFTVATGFIFLGVPYSEYSEYSEIAIFAVGGVSATEKNETSFPGVVGIETQWLPPQKR
jgi:hypothetical protein